MRPLLTTIILTMLAQPVWADKADVSLTCNDLHTELHLQTVKSLAFYKMALKPPESLAEDERKKYRAETQKTAKSYLDAASQLATIYNALCEE